MILVGHLVDIALQIGINGTRCICTVNDLSRWFHTTLLRKSAIVVFLIATSAPKCLSRFRHIDRPNVPPSAHLELHVSIATTQN